MIEDERVTTWKKCRGLDNLNNPARLRDPGDEGDSYYLTTAQNIDVDKFATVSRRSGFTQVSSSSYRYLYPDGLRIYGVSGNDLIMLDEFYNVSVLRSSVGGTDMVFVKVGTKIYYTNSLVIGYIEDETSNTLTDPSIDGKVLMPPGELMEVYGSRLWVADGKILHLSDAAAYHYKDGEKGALQFPVNITLLIGVQDGLFISADKTYFLKISDPTTPDGLTATQVVDYKAIKGTSVKKRGITIKGEFYPVAALWNSERGVCLGGNGGSFKNLTEQRYVMPSAHKGESVVRQSADLNQLISITTD